MDRKRKTRDGRLLWKKPRKADSWLSPILGLGKQGKYLPKRLFLSLRIRGQKTCLFGYF